MTKRRKASQTDIERSMDWNRKNTVGIGVRLHVEKDADLIAKFRSIPNKTEWMRECIRNY